MTKPVDLRTKSADELSDMLIGLRREQVNLRFQRATGQAEGTARQKLVRRDIARIKTIMAETSRRASAAAR